MTTLRISYSRKKAWLKMTSKNKVDSILHSYLEKFEIENNRQTVFKNFLNKSESIELYDRKNFNGHITASAFIINKSSSKILLIKHTTLNRWLQPGGHVEPTDRSILDASFREIKEEVNINKSELNLVAHTLNEEIPFDIDNHLIPSNTLKKEDEHFHYDFRYLFVYSGDENIKVNMDDVSGFKWVEFKNLIGDSVFKAVIEKINNVMHSTQEFKGNHKYKIK